MASNQFPSQLVACEDAPVDAFFPAGLQEHDQKFGKHERLPSGKGNPTAGLIEENHFPFQDGQYIIHTLGAARHLRGFSGAIVRAGAADNAAGRIGNDALRSMAAGFLGTKFNALPAADTLFCRVHFLNFGRAAFRIMAPRTGEGTTLQKNGGADARPIVNRIAFDVKNQA